MATFAGIDLAWSGRYDSGICVLEGEGAELRVKCLSAKVVTPAALAHCLASLTPPVVVAIDAPLVVSEQRWAEGALARVFGKYRAAAYTVSERFLDRSGRAGPELAAALMGAGFSLDPGDLAAGKSQRVAIEVYPHAAHVVLFGEKLSYKRGRLAARREGLARYQAFLRTALAACLNETEVSRLDHVLAPEGLLVGGRALKAIEDQLDALTCALVAWMAADGSGTRCTVFGCARHGYIVTPGLPAGAAEPPSACAACADAG